MKKKSRVYLTTLYIFCIFVILLLVFGSRYRNDQSKKISKINNENIELINAVNEQLNLPYSTPIIVTVYDPADFNSNNEISRLQKYDKLLIYLNSNEAVIYRPKDNKIIDIVSARAVLNTKDEN
jgi:hypothetical protein